MDFRERRGRRERERTSNANQLFRRGRESEDYGDARGLWRCWSNANQISCGRSMEGCIPRWDGVRSIGRGLPIQVEFLKSRRCI